VLLVAVTDAHLQDSARDRAGQGRRKEDEEIARERANGWRARMVYAIACAL
jgi:hypothetical protein